MAETFAALAALERLLLAVNIPAMYIGPGLVWSDNDAFVQQRDSRGVAVPSVAWLVTSNRILAFAQFHRFDNKKRNYL